MNPKKREVCEACGMFEDTVAHENNVAINICPKGWMTDGELRKALNDPAAREPK